MRGSTECYAIHSGDSELAREGQIFLSSVADSILGTIDDEVEVSFTRN